MIGTARRNLWLPEDTLIVAKDPLNRLPIDRRRYIEKWGQAQCCCVEEQPGPDENCPVCLSTLGSMSVENEATVCKVLQFPAAVRVLTFKTYNESPAYCQWGYGTSSPPNLNVWIYATGRLDIWYTVTTGVVIYRSEYFSGETPFDCAMDDVEVPFYFNSASDCSDGRPDSVFITLSTS